MLEHGVGCLFWEEVTGAFDHLDGHPRGALRSEHPVRRAVLAEDEGGVDARVVRAVLPDASAGSSRVRGVR